jgi:hypothetical protein
MEPGQTTRRFLTQMERAFSLIVSFEGRFVNNVQKDLPTQQQAPRKDAWLSCENGFQEWATGVAASPREGTKAAHSFSLLDASES